MEWNVSEKRSWFDVWPKNVPKSIDYPSCSLGELITKSATKYPEHTAIIHDSQLITYRDLIKRIEYFAHALKAMGVKKGDRVLLFLPNVPEYVICYYGVLHQGAIVVPINPLLKQQEFHTVFTNAEPSVIVVTNSLFQVVEHSIAALPPENVVVVDSHNDSEEYSAFNELLLNNENSPPMAEVIPEKDPAVIQFTGGTTGIPKGAMLTHFNLIANALQNCAWFQWTNKDIVMGTLPLYHSWGACCNMNSTFAVGASVFLVTRFSPETALEAIQREKVTLWYGPPTLFIMLINHPTIKKYDLSSLRYVKIGAAPIPEEIRRQWEHLMGGVKMVLGYGLTEASPETLSSPPNAIRPGTVGIPIMNTDIRIVDLESGMKQCSPGETGELIVHGPQVMKGYWRDSEQTHKALRNGWLYTGDLAKISDDGYVTIVDRLKSMIKYKGYSVFPAEIENILYSHPTVKECSVVGKPDSYAGEIPKAFVVLKPGHTSTEKELIQYCRDHIAPYKRIREVEFIDELPKTAVGKILSRQLREEEQKKYHNSITE